MGSFDTFFSEGSCPTPNYTSTRYLPLPFDPMTLDDVVDIVEIKRTQYEVVKSSDVLEAVSKGGKKYWQGHVVKDAAGVYYTATSSWQDTKTGLSKITWSTPYHADPKNIGKANETTNRSQAFFEFESMVKKEARVRNSDRPLPMLAKSFQDRKHKITYPCGIQPKLDGMRMLTDGVDNWTRKNKAIDEKDSRILEHILPIALTAGVVLDGELALPWFPKVSVIMTAVKKFEPELTPQVKYYVYDAIIPGKTFDERKYLLGSFFQRIDIPVNIVPVETYYCFNEDDIWKYHAEFVARGFEGSIIRDLNAEYSINRRVDAVLKLKDWIDQEFLILDIIPAGGGSSAEVGKFVCLADNGLSFESTATGQEQDRRDLLENKQKYIGKFAKVKYRELTEYGVPFHSNVLEIRDTKDKGY